MTTVHPCEEINPNLDNQLNPIGSKNNEGVEIEIDDTSNKENIQDKPHNLKEETKIVAKDAKEIYPSNSIHSSTDDNQDLKDNEQVTDSKPDIKIDHEKETNIITENIEKESATNIQVDESNDSELEHKETNNHQTSSSAFNGFSFGSSTPVQFDVPKSFSTTTTFGASINTNSEPQNDKTNQENQTEKDTKENKNSENDKESADSPKNTEINNENPTSQSTFGEFSFGSSTPIQFDVPKSFSTTTTFGSTDLSKEQTLHDEKDNKENENENENIKEIKGFPIGSKNIEKAQLLEDSKQKTFIGLEKFIEIPDIDRERNLYTLSILFKEEGEKELPKQEGKFRQWKICDLKGFICNLYIPLKDEFNELNFGKFLLTSHINNFLFNVFSFFF